MQIKNHNKTINGLSYSTTQIIIICIKPFFSGITRILFENLQSFHNHKSKNRILYKYDRIPSPIIKLYIWYLFLIFYLSQNLHGIYIFYIYNFWSYNLFFNYNIYNFVKY
ncbi:MAG: hypothetical protein DBY16_02900 [Coprobacter sp.]|nr:MAG: hypothetical protein DBY16_02900 [Coprobacter sp.]